MSPAVANEPALAAGAMRPGPGARRQGPGLRLWRRRRRLPVLAFTALAMFAAGLPARAQATLELKVKAAILFNLTQFVAWPASSFAHAASPLRVCVVDAPELAAELAQGLRQRTIGGRALLVLPLHGGAHLGACHLAYFGTNNYAELHEALDQNAQAPVLTVHEADVTLPAGVVRLFVVGDRLRFEINTAGAERRQLAVSSRLLSMAKVVAQ